MNFNGNLIARLLLIVALFWTNLLSIEPLYSTPNSIFNSTLTMDITNPTRVSEVDIPRLWWELLHEEREIFGLNPATAGWITAYMGIALYETAIVDLGDTSSLTAHLTTMPEMPLWESDSEYDAASGAIGTLSTVAEMLLLDTLPIGSSDRAVHQAIHGLRNLQIRDRLRYVKRAAFDSSYAHGQAIGQAVVEWTRQNEYPRGLQNSFVVPTGGEDYWKPTNRAISPLVPYWGTLPLLIDLSATSCVASKPMPFATRPGSTFHMQAEEVYHFTQTLSAEQQDIVDFWADSGTGAPVTRWMLVASRIIDQKALRLVDAAALYARLGIVFHDVSILAWRTKYEKFLLRPETYINRYIDNTWKPLQTTQNSPSYISAAAAYSGAGAEVLTSVFGISNFDETREGVNDRRIIRHFTTFEALAYESGMAQLYSGMNYRASIEAGWRQGRCIGRLVHL